MTFALLEGADGMAWMFAPLLALPLVISAFWWMGAPTKRGRAIMDRIAGFEQYLSITEEERFEALHPPEKTPELFERYLPYAIALDVENSWAHRFSGVLAAAAADPSPAGQRHDLVFRLEQPVDQRQRLHRRGRRRPWRAASPPPRPRRDRAAARAAAVSRAAAAAAAAAAAGRLISSNPLCGTSRKTLAISAAARTSPVGAISALASWSSRASTSGDITGAPACAVEERAGRSSPTDRDAIARVRSPTRTSSTATSMQHRRRRRRWRARRLVYNNAADDRAMTARACRALRSGAERQPHHRWDDGEATCQGFCGAPTAGFAAARCAGSGAARVRSRRRAGPDHRRRSEAIGCRP